MLRSLDFTVEPDNTYRFRVRIVVVNPNKDHTDVNPGVDVESKELLGPWSEPTDPVTVPADVAAYAQAPEPGDPPRRPGHLPGDQVGPRRPARPSSRTTSAGPGEIDRRVRVGPDALVRGRGAQAGRRSTSTAGPIVLDTLGGPQRLPDIGLERNQFVDPRPGDDRRARRLGRHPRPGRRQGRRGPRGHGGQLQAGHRGLGNEAQTRRLRVAGLPGGRRPSAWAVGKRKQGGRRG